MKKLLFMAGVAMLLFSQPAQAAFNTVNIQPVFPENQKREVTNYFNLRMDKKDDTIELTFRLSNPNDKEVTLKAFSGEAISSPDGYINITSNPKKMNSRITNAEYQMKNRISVEKNIHIPARSTKEVKVKVETPTQKKGLYMGGVIFETAGEPDTQKKKINQNDSITFEIKNRLQFTYAIVLDYTEPKNSSLTSSTKSSFQFNEGTITRVRGSYEAMVPLQNLSNELKQATEVTIRLMKDNQLFKEQSYPLFKMAPYTETNLSLPLPNYLAKYGDLSAHITYTLDGTKHKAIQEVDLVRTKSDQLAVTDVIQEYTPQNGISLTWVLIIVFLVGIAGFFLGKRKTNSIHPRAIESEKNPEIDFFAPVEETKEEAEKEEQEEADESAEKDPERESVLEEQPAFSDEASKISEDLTEEPGKAVSSVKRKKKRRRKK